MQGPMPCASKWGRTFAWWMGYGGTNADHYAVMSALSTYADENGVCCPAQTTLSKLLGRSRPWVNRVVSELESAGLLAKRSRRRGNGGMTSCEYTLARTPPGTPQATAASHVGGPTASRPEDDTGCHGGDTRNSTNPNNKARPPAGAPRRDSITIRAAEATDEEADAAPAGGKEEVDLGWAPSAAALARAKAASPGTDAAMHAAMFVSRCVAKGYRYRPEALDQAWLGWFFQDTLRDARQASPDGKARKAYEPPKSAAQSMYDAFAAVATETGTAWSRRHA